MTNKLKHGFRVKKQVLQPVLLLDAWAPKLIPKDDIFWKTHFGRLTHCLSLKLMSQMRPKTQINWKNRCFPLSLAFFNNDHLATTSIPVLLETFHSSYTPFSVNLWTSREVAWMMNECLISCWEMYTNNFIQQQHRSQQRPWLLLFMFDTNPKGYITT